jgi:hypothetical protein
VKVKNPDLSASTIERALDELVEAGDVGARELSDRQGQPVLYWLSRDTGEGAAESGVESANENAVGSGEKREDVSLNPTHSYTLNVESNKPQSETEGKPRHSQGDAESEQGILREGEGGEGEAEHAPPSLAETTEQGDSESGVVLDEDHFRSEEEEFSAFRSLRRAEDSQTHLAHPLDCPCVGCAAQSPNYARPRSTR